MLAKSEETQFLRVEPVDLRPYIQDLWGGLDENDTSTVAQDAQPPEAQDAQPVAQGVLTFRARASNARSAWRASTATSSASRRSTRYASSSPGAATIGELLSWKREKQD